VPPAVLNPSPLDDSLINRAAPPGSMRYFTLLYTPADQRAAITAMYVIDAELRESAQSANHDVAHTRLQWWRQEFDRLVNANPQHPATRILNAAPGFDRKQFARLHELLAAADMDLARMTYLNQQELRAYCSRCGGVLHELIAMLLLPGPMDEPTRAAANRIGIGVRQTEILRDLRQDAHDGRLYLPLETLDRVGVSVEDLRGNELSESVKGLLADFRAAVVADLELQKTAFEPATRAYLRPLFVMAGLHRRLLDRIASHRYDVASRRIELGPVEKPWVAWRSARAAG